MVAEYKYEEDGNVAKLTNEQLAEIRQRAEAATAGPWLVSPDECGPEGQGVFNEEDFGCICEVGDPYPRGNNKPTENMKFIANARTDIPALLDMITEMQAEINRERGLKAWYRDKAIKLAEKVNTIGGGNE